ncbi:MAG: D-alanine--D-alanine ligase [bacterium]|jgi:D-alanine-D-alanine ligase|nr:D-alanine--D-alanine ligase [candidate division KSB1 bacterium]MDH7561371.1 D-alanine--D-alanine ligase [bacterium]
MRTSRQGLKVLVAYDKLVPPVDDDPDWVSEAAVRYEVEAVYQALLRLGHQPAHLAVDDIGSAIEEVRRAKPDVIFNLCEAYKGKAQHEMAVAGVWELLGVPYTGNPPLALGMAQNKVVAKRLFAAAGIRTPAYHVYTAVPRPTDLCLPLPAIAKPSQEDASLGITAQSVVKEATQLPEVVEALLTKYRQPVLVEEYVDGREFNVSVLDGEPPQVLPLSEIDFSVLDADTPRITSYEAKWLPDHPLFQSTPAVCPARVEEGLRRRLERTALRVFHLLHGRDYGRVDMRLDAKGAIFVLEFNPNPDISPAAGYARALRAAGITFEEFVDHLLAHALSRGCNDHN